MRHIPRLLSGARIPYRLAFLVAQDERIGTSHQLSGKDHVRRFLFDFEPVTVISSPLPKLMPTSS
jgi:hypothetical protein